MPERYCVKVALLNWRGKTAPYPPALDLLRPQAYAPCRPVRGGTQGLLKQRDLYAAKTLGVLILPLHYFWFILDPARPQGTCLENARCRQMAPDGTTQNFHQRFEGQVMGRCPEANRRRIGPCLRPSRMPSRSMPLTVAQTQKVRFASVECFESRVFGPKMTDFEYKMDLSGQFWDKSRHMYRCLSETRQLALATLVVNVIGRLDQFPV